MNIKTILSNINLTIKKSEVLGLVGKTGVGKTTILDLLLGFVKPKNGHIKVDDYLIKEEDMNSLRKISGYVTQDTSFVDNTILENIAFGSRKREINTKLINDILSICQLDELIRSLPNGINTVMGDKGIKFSGGQCQRIGIARALYLQPQLLILDEATNALDNTTEKNILSQIRTYFNGITIVLITHRMSTLEYCDKIFSLNKDQIKEIKIEDIKNVDNLCKENSK